MAGLQSDHDLDSVAASRQELLRRNRELAQARDELSRNKQLVQQWHSRYLEMNARLKEVQGELTKLKGGGESAEPSGSQKLEGYSDYLAASLVDANEKLATESKLRRVMMSSLAEANEKLATESKLRQELSASLAEANEKLATESKVRQGLSASLANANEKLATESNMWQDLSASLADANEKLAIESKMRQEMETAAKQVAKQVEELRAQKCAAATEASKTSSEKLVAEVERLRGLLTAERSLRAAAEVQAKKSLADREGLTRQLQRTTGELKQKLAAAAVAAASAASKTRQPSVAEEQLEKLQARARILNVENVALRANAANHRQRIAEMTEGQAMAAEELRSRKLEALAAAQEATKRGALVEETRRARRLEMDTIIKKMDSLSQSSRANNLQIITKVAKPEAPRGSELLRFARVGGC